MLHGAGARVVAMARSLRAHPAEGVHYVAADLSTEDGCAAVAKSIMARFGGVDIVVNVAGGSSAPAGPTTGETRHRGALQYSRHSHQT
jgi:NAD(P)-dependent dehydrogenase (short-subunit alcohol dehydrogenase family)